MALKDKIQSMLPQKPKDDSKKKFTRSIGPEDVKKATEILKKYKQGKNNLENRIIENEQWYKMRHWEQIRASKNGQDPEPASAWLFNSIANKHADAMDNFPSPNVLPREEGDREAAENLSQIIPVILERNNFEQTYSDAWWYKLKAGSAVYGVFWNPALENGLGDIDIKKIDILNLFWEPGKTDIQKSRNLFLVALVDNDILEAQYPKLKGKLGSNTVDISTYVYDDTVDTSNKSAVVDWYYKRQNEWGGTILHYCKFVNDEILFASENDPKKYPDGFYAHGLYPFQIDTLFPEEGTPCGFGYVDVMKDSQMYIDKLNQVILKNAILAARPRYFIKDNGSVNEKEFADISKDFVHVSGTGLGEDSLRPVDVPELPGNVLAVLQMKIDELKETSGNRDFSQGGTTSGVTAASAIAALQEAGSKLSRDMIKASYRTFQQINYLCLELIRQFYDEPRSFRILGKQGGTDFVLFDNSGIKPQKQDGAFGVDFGSRKPVFDIKITSQKASPFTRIAQNEFAKELYMAGFFNPELTDQVLPALEMMDFEGKSMVQQKVTQNGTLFKQVQVLQQQLQQMAALVDNAYGSQILPTMMQEISGQGGLPIPSVQSGSGSSGSGMIETNMLGEEMPQSEASAAGKARKAAASRSTPKV